jgi:predicted AlkP superfamily phosphohydrolase/phosphomutase
MKLFHYLIFILCCLILGVPIYYSIKKSPPKIIPTDYKVILLGADGLTEEIITRLIQQGKLPNMKYIREHGSYGRITSIEKTLSPAIWTSIATGKKREDHGIPGFLIEDEKGEVFFTNRSHRKVKALWNILSERRKKVGITCYFTTWPVEEVNGFMISKTVDFPIEDSFYPPQIRDIIKEVLRPYINYDLDKIEQFARLDLEEQFQYFTPEMLKLLDQLGSDLINGYQKLKYKKNYSKVEWEQYRDFFKYNETITEAVFKAFFLDHLKFEYAKRLFSPELDFFTLLLKGPDIVSHHNWGFYEPGPGISMADIASFKDLIPNYYVFIDRVLGYFLKAADPNTIIILVSDHGFAKCHKLVMFDINRILNTMGLLDYKPDGKVDQSKVYDSKDFFWRDKKDRMIFVNLNNLFRKRNPDQDKAKMEQIVARLDAVRVGKNRLFGELKFFPLDEEPGRFIIHTMISDTLHGGKDNCLPACAELGGTITIDQRKYPIDRYFQFSLAEGKHDTYDGIVYFLGPIIKPKNLIKSFNVLDMTPAILKIFDMPIAADMAGAVPINIFKSEFLIQHPPRYIKSYDTTIKKLPKIIPRKSPLGKKIKKDLRALGYIQ